MKVFLDTNVLVSALLWKGESFKFVSKAVEDGHELLVCPLNLIELSDLLRRDFSLSDEKRSEYLGFVIKLCGLVFDKDELLNSALHVNDKTILETALKHADVLVTYDKALLKTKAKIRIVTPSRF